MQKIIKNGPELKIRGKWTPEKQCNVTNENMHFFLFKKNANVCTILLLNFPPSYTPEVKNRRGNYCHSNMYKIKAVKVCNVTNNLHCNVTNNV